MGHWTPTSLKMKTTLLFSVLVAAALAAPEARFSCAECVDEMHKLGWMVKMGAVPIHDYVSANYCPTLGEDQAWCEEALSRYYVGMLFAVVDHYFVDGAVHVCQTGGACDAAKEYTCDECIQGLEWVEAYIEDPIMIAEYVIYLEQNYCLSGHHHDQDKCKRLVVEHFATCTLWPWRSSSSPQRSACRSPSVELTLPLSPPCFKILLMKFTNSSTE